MLFSQITDFIGGGKIKVPKKGLKTPGIPGRSIYFEKCTTLCLTLIVFLFAFSTIAAAATLTVGAGDEDFSSIQDAVSSASQGDTILISSGTYTENINVDKQLEITSVDGASSTSVVAALSSEHIFSISADGVVISGLSVSGTDEDKAGFFLTSQGNTLRDNIILDNWYGIHLSSCEENMIANNEVGNNRYDIYLSSSSNNVIESNDVGSDYYSEYGVYLDSSDYNTVIDNSAHMVRNTIIRLTNSNSNTITNNDASGSDSGNGISLSSSNRNSLDDNTVSYNNNVGIVLSSSSENSIKRNTVHRNMVYGILLGASDNNIITDNEVEDNDLYGIFLSSSGNNLIHNNIFDNNDNAGFEETNTGNQWNTSKTGGENIIGGSYLAGNFWATPDETGFSETNTDGDGDGICDSPYALDPDNTDNLALTVNTVSVPNHAPVASIDSISPDSATEGDSVTFTGSGADSDGSIVAYKWYSSIDGDLSDSANFSTSILSIGTHIISFNVQDNDGSWSELVSSTLDVIAAEQDFTDDTDSSSPILEKVSPEIDSSFDVETTTVDVRFNYIDEQTGINVSSVVFTFDSFDVTGNANTTITETNASYTANDLGPGTYEASVYLVDNSGNSATFRTSFTIDEESSSDSVSSSSSSSGSSSGGGGGGSTGESYANILVKEASSTFVNKGEHIRYEFKKDENAITSVQFDSLKNSGSIQAVVEVLKERSSFADIDAPGKVYQQMNIWVGKVGFVNGDNVENLLVTFRVDKAWFTEKNINSSNIKLYRYSDDEWNAIPTSITGEDTDYVFYESQTPGFSPFAITATISDAAVTEKGNVSADESLKSILDGESSVVATTPTKSNSGLVLLVAGLLSAVLIGTYILNRKRS